ncbi:MAG: carboxylating nicotinate-nucleotide diphosphorylase [Gammaproteobacteria bacterium]|nr:carboxylating nicotinate-nucleotide diphosphorylase [Gammaproteobacteria bacterium]
MISENLKHDIAVSVTRALQEDIGTGDVSAELIPPNRRLKAEVICRQEAVICGTYWVDQVFHQIDPDLKTRWHAEDGDEVVSDQLLFTVTGSARSILTGERSALNFLQTLSATATSSRYYANLVKHTDIKLLDTRKTIPGLRLAQKYAVTCGGCHNHRMGLFDAYLIKENHILACGSIRAAVSAAKKMQPDLTVEVEVENLEEFHQAVAAQADIIMLDNFSIEDMRAAVSGINHNIKLEASGGISGEAELIAIAETGVDYVSMGALTKHCRAVDLSMRFRELD